MRAEDRDYPLYVFSFSGLKVFLANFIFSSSGRLKNSNARPNTSACLKLNGVLTRYAKPVVAKTLYNLALRAILSGSDSPEAFLRGARSTIGRDENVVDILTIFLDKSLYLNRYSVRKRGRLYTLRSLKDSDIIQDCISPDYYAAHLAGPGHEDNFPIQQAFSVFGS